MTNEINQSRLKLRGHHIGVFANLYWSDDYLKILNSFTAEYGSEFVTNLDEAYTLLQTQPDTEVEIVEGLDSICMANCQRLYSSCTGIGLRNEDAFTLKQYGLEIGNVYTVKEVLQKIVNFTSKTGIRNPRDR